MTTITLTGTKITQDPVSGAATAVAPITLELVATGTITGFTYSIIFSDPDFGLDDVHIDRPILNNATYSDGTQLDGANDGITFGDVHWTQGGVAKVSTLMFIKDNSTTSGYLFQIGGDTIPTLNTVAAYNAFGGSFTSYSSGTGAYAPGVVIPFAPIPDAVVNENDIIYGTGGDDTSGVGAGILDGGIGDDIIYGLGGTDLLIGGDGNDKLYGGNGQDRLLGGLGNDVLNGGDGADTVDYYSMGTGVQIFLNLGKARASGDYDRLVSIENVVGSTGDDYIVGTSGSNWISSHGGNDVIRTNGGNDAVYSGSGDDKIYGDVDNEYIQGEAGNDIIFGFAGNDGIYGGTGNDYLYGGKGKDSVNGGAGDDVIHGNLGNDTLKGNDGSDRIFGGGSNDKLIGGAGKDYLYGENGNDTLNGGAGNDSMTGGAGADVFVFEAQAAANYDRVKDFTNDEDRLDLGSFGFASFADVQALATDAGWALKLDFGGSNVLYLEGFAFADFDTTDVIL